MNKNICIVIPCHNEEKRLHQRAYENFLHLNSEALLCFVEDGSSDDSLRVLKGLQSKFPNNILVLSNPKNLGKAETVRNGMHYCLEHLDFETIAYLDADLSTSLEECYSLSTYLSDEISFVFGSRMMKTDSVIKRRRYRYLIGRVVATAIAFILKLKVYDTQCGCKLFKKELALQVFKEPFISKWLFDVEIFHRIIMYYGRNKAIHSMLEVPLKRWVDTGKSEVKFSYFLRMWKDLYLIYRKSREEEEDASKNLKSPK